MLLVIYLQDKAFLILFWLHFLAMNLFCGGWIVKDSQKFGINKILMCFPLINNLLHWTYRFNASIGL